MSDKIVCIKKYLNRHEADVAKSVLDSNQIDCYVASDDSGSMRPSLSFVSPIRLMVKEENATQALEVLGNNS
jgi:hypothetical protein